LLAKEIEENRKINVRLEIANNQLKELTLLDELTGIPNRRSFREFIDRAFQFYIKECSAISIIMIDIDFFKQFNDFYGHDEGDKALIAVANQITSVVDEPSEFVVRWGGEEFIYAAFNKSQEVIAETANVIRAKISDLKIPHNDSPINQYISVSLGSCTIQITDKKDISKAIKLADSALYMAKNSGRNCVKTLSGEGCAIVCP
jgi:diguanylate cyclase (GGDEF)-like protein